MKKKSAIRVLEAKAKSGDVNASFQLAEYYAQGQFVEQDNDKANFYYERVLENFKSPILKISSLKLVNFRIFEEIDLVFSKQSKLILFVGINGAGKTTILEAIAKSLLCIVRHLVNPSPPGNFIDFMDINNHSKLDYTSIISEYLVGEIKYNLELSKSKESSNSKRSSQYQEIKQLAELYKLANSRDDEVNFPIMAFYSVERAVEINSRDTAQFDEITEKNSWNKFSGYYKALNGSAEFKLFFRWFKHLDDINNEKNSLTRPNQDIFNAIEKLQAELNSDFVKEMEKRENLDDKTKEFLSAFKRDKENQIKQLQADLVEETLTKESKTIDSVTKAIYDFMPGFNNLRIQRSPSLEMLIDKNGLTLNILQLSQGEKSLFALVADIARRLVLLNPSLSDPLQGNGIVLIDEIDLHLHPGWQQSVIPYLLNTFPNIQFIVTTHSPQVLSTVHRESIRLLGKDPNGRAVATMPLAESYGEISSDVLESIMHVNPQPPVAEREELERLTEWVDQGQYNTEDAISLFAKLKTVLDETHPQLQKLARSIQRQELLKQ